MTPLLRRAFAALLLAAGGLVFAAQPEPAALPEQSVDVAMPETNGTTIAVRAGDSFQAALDRAQPGDVIELEAGAEFRGPFTLPNKSGDGWIVVRGSRDSELVAPGTRVEAEHAHAMPVLSAEGNAVVTTAPGAHHVRFVGIAIRPAPGKFIYNVVEIGNGTEQQDALPHHVVFDRCVLSGDPELGARRGLAFNGAHLAVIDSHLYDFKEQGADSQAVAGWNGPGPFLIANNRLEGAGENVMFGGATPAIDGLVPADIEIRGNYFTKPLSWKIDDASYAGTPWTIKNLLEFKNARRVLVDGNVFEHNWAQGQNGIAVLLTPRNEGGAAPWAVVEDITFTNNIVSGTAGGFNMLGQDDNGKPSGQTARIVIRNNLFHDMGGKWGQGPLFQMLNGVADVTIERNTALNAGSIILAEGAPHANVSFRSNIVRNNEYGMIGTGTGMGLQTLERYFPEALVTGNAIIGGEMRSYPEGNFYPVSDKDAGLGNAEAGDFRLNLDRRLRRGETNDVGADIDAMCAAFAPTERSRVCARQ